MHKLIFLVFLFCLSGCEYNDVKNSLYVGSIHLACSDGKYVGTFFIPSSVSMGKNPTESENYGDYVIIEDASFSGVFSKAELSSEMQMNFNHLSSFVLDKSFISIDNLEKFCFFIKDNGLFDYNFYIFGCEESAEELFSFKNPNAESSLNTILLAPISKDYLHLLCKPVHFLRLADMVYSKKTIRLPVVSFEYEYSVNGKETKGFIQDGICFLSEETEFVYVYDNYGLGLLLDHSAYAISNGEFSVLLQKYDIDISYKNPLVLRVKTYYHVQVEEGFSESKLAELIVEEIEEALTLATRHDILDLEYYGYVFGKSLSYQNINIKVEQLNDI